MSERMPSSEELEGIRKAHAEADPTTYSQLPPKEPLRDTGQLAMAGYYNTIHEADGSQYIRINEKPEAQQLEARFLKGIVNVSDIVVQGRAFNKRYFSRILPLEKIREETTSEEVEADILLFAALFGDADHNMEGLYVEDKHDHNFRRKDGRAAYFDFAQMTSLFNTKRTDYYSKIIELKKDPQVLNILENKAKALRDRFSGGEGKRFIASTLESVGDIHDQFYSLRDPYVKVEDQVAFVQEELIEHLAKIESSIAKARAQLPK